MPSLSVPRLCTEITASTAALADLISEADPTRAVPTCPEWTLKQLTTHVGRGQRWAAQIVSTRSATLIPFRDVADGRLPDDPARRPAWLRAGASHLADAVAAAGPAPVWALGDLQPAGFWARRMAHESAVHLADAQIATGRQPAIDPEIAADGIDEWLGFMTAPRPGEADPRMAVLAGGRVLHVHATDASLGAGGEWLVRSTPDGVSVEGGHSKGDVAVRGPASGLLLVLVRRLAPGDAAVEVIGDQALLHAWLAATPF